MSYELTGFDGKVAVVTGAGRMRSIGRPIAVELARAGCDVVVTGTGRGNFTDEEKAAGWRDIESVAEEIEALGRKALPVVADLGDRASIERLAATVLDTFGRIDILVNNAAAARAGDRVPVVDLEWDAWRTVLGVNLDGVFSLSQVFARAMRDAGRGGSIVNISSVGGKLAAANTAAYAASKSGVHALTSAMAKELGRDDIRVNAICPGIIDTSRLDDMRQAGRYEQIVDANIPLGRAGSGLDIAAMAVFLCSDQGSWISGQAWNVDGGQLTIR